LANGGGVKMKHGDLVQKTRGEDVGVVASVLEIETDSFGTTMVKVAVIGPTGVEIKTWPKKLVEVIGESN
tara:strand:+ start:373 stop:582 length:210 start_codon:yes stop_codon:yes gene_type:complete